MPRANAQHMNEEPTMRKDTMTPDRLATYKAKRDFSITGEPKDGGVAHDDALSFVVQKHWATALHYDFRIELDGVMLSWAVPKGPSLDTHDKRLAAHVEDHPISYSSFEGTIPTGQYGAGRVIVWDEGTWHPIGDPHAGLLAGDLKFELRGQKLKGRWVLVRMKGRSGKQEPWLLIKERDEFARPASEFSVVDALPDSVKSSSSPPAPVKKANKAAVKGTRPSAKPGRSSAAAMALPASLSPQLATLAEAPTGAHSDWIFEIKFDGYRLLARVESDEIRLFTRNGNDWTAKLEPLRAEIERMQLPSGWYDGEIVVLNDKGVSDFGALQNAFDASRTRSIVWYVFDAPFLAGQDMRATPLEYRRTALRAALVAVPSAIVRFSEAFDAKAEHIVASACHLGLEGVIAKRRDSLYRSTRSADWIKLKCSHRQEFVIGGWTDPKASRTGIGSLLLGVYEDGKLRYAGHVGSGFDTKALASTRSKLDDIASDTSPFADGTTIPGKPHWVTPRLVAEVTFGEWTSAGHIRHGVFHGLRMDKAPADITRETALSAPRGTTPGSLKTGVRQLVKTLPRGPASHALDATRRMTHAERVVDSTTGITKLDVATYYDSVGKLMMPHLKGRAVSLVRALSGIAGPLFFQKHAEVEKLPGIEQLDVALDLAHPPMLGIVDAEGLFSAAQWNVLEIHTHNALAADYEHPDRIVFDLDPGEGAAWPIMQEAAERVRVFLADLGLGGFLKTSGGKGLHVVVPLKPKAGWEATRMFSRAVVDHLAESAPQLFVSKSGSKNRVGRIFIDYLRNGRGATTAAAWSARSRPGMGISVPVAWEELKDLRGGDHWTLRSIQSRLDVGNAPWSSYRQAARALDIAAKQLGVES